MNSRRTFIKKVGSGVVASALAPGLLANSYSEKKQIILGIIGAENSHTAGFGRMFNIYKKFPGVELKYL